MPVPLRELADSKANETLISVAYPDVAAAHEAAVVVALAAVAAPSVAVLAALLRGALHFASVAAMH